MCLARALLQDSRVLLMDEASAFIDLETDRKLQQMVREELHTCTVITIAHRLATIMDYDFILVLDKGKVIEFDEPWCLLNNPYSSDAGLKSLVEEGGPDSAAHLTKIAKDAYKARKDYANE